MEKLRIVFMGTPDFAVGILKTLLTANLDVVGVVTAADKPAGRGQKINYSAVKQFAIENNLKLLQPVSLKSADFLAELAALNANLQVVVAFRMLPETVWKMPEFGTINLHASLLPNYRGAAPINWAIINGETQTGVTTFFIDDKIDTGAIIKSNAIAIDTDIDAGTLHDQLMLLGSKTVIETLELIAQQKAFPIIQEDNPNLKTAYKLHKENCRIDWQESGENVKNLIRGLSPYPSAWTVFIDGEKTWDVKIESCEFIREAHDFKAGKIFTTKKELKVAVKNGYIYLNKVQFPGKKKMLVHELLNGIQFSENAFAK